MQTIGHHSTIVTRHALCGNRPAGRRVPFKTHAASRHPCSAGGGGGGTDQGTFQGRTAHKGETRRPAPAARWPGSGGRPPAVGARTAPYQHPSRKWGGGATVQCPLPVSPADRRNASRQSTSDDRHETFARNTISDTSFSIQIRDAKKENAYRNWAIAIYDRQKEKHL